MEVGREHGRNNTTRFQEDESALHDRSCNRSGWKIGSPKPYSLGRGHTVTRRESIIGSLQHSFWNSPSNREGTLRFLAPSALNG